MPKIIFTPSNIEITCEPMPLLEAAKLAEVSIDAPCGSKGTCGKCIVQITRGIVDSNSQGLLSPTALADGFVLACKTNVLDDDIVVDIPEQSNRKGGKFTNSHEDLLLVREELFPKNWEYDPLAIKWAITVDEAELEDGLSDMDRTTRALQKHWGKQEVIYPLSVLRKLAKAVRLEDGLVTVTMIRDEGVLRVIDIEAGDNSSKQYGIAVDIGTTTVAVQLVFLPLAKIITTKTDYNDQITNGLDVISRINYANTPEKINELRERVLKTINNLIADICVSHNIKTDAISNAVLSGNTVMTHMLLGMNSDYIRLMPFTPTILETPYLTAKDVGVNINEDSWVYISPSVGSYVGGDITAGILCTDLALDKEDVSLFIDIGTNGEIVLGNSDFLMCCACSAGPAFEGGGIEYGMRAAIGAVEDVSVNKETGKARYKTIGGVKAKGVCGSGMISLLAELFRTNWIDAGGKLNRETTSPYVITEGKVAKYILVPKEESANGKDIIITEIDIDNIIRTKAAIYSACDLMLEQIEMTFNDVETIYIAGGFGRFLDIENSQVIGLLPDAPKEKFKYIGNSSLTGTYMTLVSHDYKDKQIELAKKMTYIELGTDSSYMDKYSAATFLPHTDPKLFPNIKVN